MTKKSQPRRSTGVKKAKFKDKPFEPPPEGTTTPTNPPPLIEKPPFGGGDDEK